MSSVGLERLQRAVTAIRGEHRGCDGAACPWPTMYDEDVNELNEALTACGYEITKTRTEEGETGDGRSAEACAGAPVEQRQGPDATGGGDLRRGATWGEPAAHDPGH